MNGPELWHLFTFEGDSGRFPDPESVRLVDSVLGCDAADARRRAIAMRHVDGRRRHLAVRAADVVLLSPRKPPRRA